MSFNRLLLAVPAPSSSSVGPQGPQGPAGPQGSVGAQGPPGTTPTDANYVFTATLANGTPSSIPLTVRVYNIGKEVIIQIPAYEMVVTGSGTSQLRITPDAAFLASGLAPTIDEYASVLAAYIAFGGPSINPIPSTTVMQWSVPENLWYIAATNTGVTNFTLNTNNHAERLTQRSVTTIRYLIP